MQFEELQSHADVKLYLSLKLVKIFIMNRQQTGSLCPARSEIFPVNNLRSQDRKLDGK